MPLPLQAQIDLDYADLLLFFSKSLNTKKLKTLEDIKLGVHATFKIGGLSNCVLFFLNEALVSQVILRRV